MRVIGATASRRRRRYAGVALSIVLGALFVAGGIWAALVVFGTPVVSQLAELGTGRVGRGVSGILAWTLALLVPGILLVLGATRLSTALADALDLRRPPRPVEAIRSRLPDDLVLAQDLVLPDGRRIPEVVVGPFGLAVVQSLPPPRAARLQGGGWEVRGPGGRWLPMEDPLERAGRDAERLRHWIASVEDDLSPRVFAAVVADGHAVERRREVAVVQREQLPAWFGSIPPGRQMSQERRESLVEILRSAVADRGPRRRGKRRRVC